MLGLSGRARSGLIPNPRTLTQPSDLPTGTPRAGGGLHTARPYAFLVPPDVLGHLMHRVQLKCPKELWVMMGEVSLGRIEQLLLGLSCELRPALAEGDPTIPVLICGRGHDVTQRCLAAPTRGRRISCGPGDHGAKAVVGPLSIRFQIVAGG